MSDNKYKIKIETYPQFNIALDFDDVSDIIISRDSFDDSAIPKMVSRVKNKNKKCWILLERISRYEEFKKQELRISTDKIFEIPNLDGIIIQNLDEFSYLLRKINKVANKNLLVELNYTMNCYNIETKRLYEKLYNEKRENANDIPLFFTAPLELNIYELADVKYDTFILYSYIDTMVSANCLRKIENKDNCKNRFDFEKVEDFDSYIIDRKNKKLHYKSYCKYCYNKIFNTDPLYLLDKLGEFDIDRIRDLSKNSLSSSFFRIDFSFENENEMKKILQKKCPDNFTRGHFKNSIY